MKILKNSTAWFKKHDLSGKRFGKLKVIKFLYFKKLYDKEGKRRAFFLCKCDCGGKKIANGNQLQTGHIKSCGCIVERKYFIDETYFKKINREDKAYFLGLLITDGTVSKEENKKNQRIILEMQKKDRHILDTFKKFLKTKKPLGYSKRKARKYKKYKIGKSETYVLNISNIQMRKDIIKLGIKPQKTKTVSLPSNKIIPHRLMRHFIRGVFDGDGTSSKTRTTRTVSITSGSIKFLKQLKKYLTKYNIFNTTIVKYTRRSPGLGSWSKNSTLSINPALIRNSRRNKITSENQKRFFDLLYKNSSKDLFLIRKKRNFINAMK